MRHDWLRRNGTAKMSFKFGYQKSMYWSRKAALSWKVPASLAQQGFPKILHTYNAILFHTAANFTIPVRILSVQ